ncbi:MAG: hypothetical protein KGL39_56355 [Patescibacteria group bacterium]|nr:hypothetical protein [Patescibacteria group bacterium]
MNESTEDLRILALETLYKELLQRVATLELRIASLETGLPSIRSGSGIQ